MELLLGISGVKIEDELGTIIVVEEGIEVIITLEEVIVVSNVVVDDGRVLVTVEKAVVRLTEAPSRRLVLGTVEAVVKAYLCCCWTPCRRCLVSTSQSGTACATKESLQQIALYSMY